MVLDESFNNPKSWLEATSLPQAAMSQQLALMPFWNDDSPVGQHEGLPFFVFDDDDDEGEEDINDDENFDDDEDDFDDSFDDDDDFDNEDDDYGDEDESYDYEDDVEYDDFDE